MMVKSNNEEILRSDNPNKMSIRHPRLFIRKEKKDTSHQKDCESIDGLWLLLIDDWDGPAVLSLFGDRIDYRVSLSLSRLLYTRAAWYPGDYSLGEEHVWMAKAKN